jgi:hypothetical protein
VLVHHAVLARHPRAESSHHEHLQAYERSQPDARDSARRPRHERLADPPSARSVQREVRTERTSEAADVRGVPNDAVRVRSHEWLVARERELKGEVSAERRVRGGAEAAPEHTQRGSGKKRRRNEGLYACKCALSGQEFAKGCAPRVRDEVMLDEDQQDVRRCRDPYDRLDTS